MYTWATLKRTIRELRDDNLTDWAAALTYYSVLALFPGLIVLVAILGLVGQHPETTNALLDIVRDVGPASAVDTFRGPIESVVKSNGGAGALIGVGLLFAIWSASGYIGAFMRAMNVIYEVEEGRSFWKRRPLQIVITIAMVLLLALVAVSIVVTGPLARAIGDEVGLGDTAITIWNIAKWPVIVVVVMGMFTVLYYVSPNVRQQRLRWVTPGGIVAVVLWLLASAGFGLYVANFGSYDKTYGSLGGVIVFLVWLWLSNLALLFGAEFDAELERSRELAAGLPAEESLQLPERDPPDDQRA
jgi:membrane protein